MKLRFSLVLRSAAVIALLMLASSASAQTPPLSPMITGKVGAGADVTPSYHGWFKNPDGSFGLLFGYYNRNEKEALDLPIGPGNHFEPGEADRGQPTYFLSNGYHEAMFTVKVPADFGKQRLTWVLTAHGKTNSVPAWLHPDYEISPFEGTASVVGEINSGNKPPVVWFEEGGPSIQGPRPESLVLSRTATVGEPLALTVWAADDMAVISNSGAAPKRAPVLIEWSQYRGPGGAAKFDKEKPAAEKMAAQKNLPFTGKATNTVTFSAPGDYVLQVLAEDYGGTGEFGGTTARVRVSVKAK